LGLSFSSRFHPGIKALLKFLNMIEVCAAKVKKKKSGILRIKDCGVIKFYTYLLKKETSQRFGQLMRSLQ
jgi:hypothetical protein